MEGISLISKKAFIQYQEVLVSKGQAAVFFERKCSLKEMVEGAFHTKAPSCLGDRFKEMWDRIARSSALFYK